MGKLVDGDWVAKPARGHDDQGFDGWIGSSDGQSDAEFPAETDRTTCTSPVRVRGPTERH